MKKLFILMFLCAGMSSLSAQNISMNSVKENNKNSFTVQGPRVKKAIAENEKESFTQEIIKRVNATSTMQIKANDLKLVDKSSDMLKISKTNDEALQAFFDRPEGTYLRGLIGASHAEGGGVYATPGIVGAAYSIPWVLRNYSVGATSYRWTWGSEVYSTEKDAALTAQYTDGTSASFMSDGLFYMPSLQAINGSSTSTYSPVSLAAYGGGDALLFSSSYDGDYVSNADLYGNTTTLGNGSLFSSFLISALGGQSLDGKGDGYFWGSCYRPETNTRVHSVINFHEKPMAPMVIKDVTAFAASTSSTPVPADAAISLKVWKLDENNELTDELLGEGRIYGGDIVVEETGDCMLYFTFFETDPATGREREIVLVVEDAFAIEISGFEQDGCDLGLVSDLDNMVESTSYFTQIDMATGQLNSGLYRSDGSGMNTYMVMNVLFNYLYAEPNFQTVVAPVEGGYAVDQIYGEVGSYVFSLFDFQDEYGEDMIWYDATTLPSWLDIEATNQYYEEEGFHIFVFNAEPLPTGVSGRAANVKIQSYGAETILTILQGDVTSIEDVQSLKTNVWANNNSFELTYSNDFTSAVIYTVTGQLVGNYVLPENGQLSVPVSNLQKGTYLVKFLGKNSKTVKVVK